MHLQPWYWHVAWLGPFFIVSSRQSIMGDQSHPPPCHHHHPLHQIGTSSLKCGDVGFIIPGNPLNVLESVARGITVTLQLAKRRTLNLNLEGCIASVVSVQQPRPSVILINKTPLKSLCICFSLHVGPALFLDNLVNLDNNSKAIKGGEERRAVMHIHLHF